MSITLQDALQRTIEHREIFHDEMLSLMRQIMSGEVSPVMIAALTVGLRVKKETIGEIAAAAQVMRELATPVHAPGGHVVDIVGTGGDVSGSFNVSTAAAMVVAAAGGTVAKHGNRAVSGKTGAADVLEAAGVRLDLTPAQVEQCLAEVGVAFLFAPQYHGAMKHAIGPRREMAVRTIFNVLGPLTNPLNRKLRDLSGREIWVLLPMLAMAFWLGICPKTFLKDIDPAVSATLAQIREKFAAGPSEGKPYMLGGGDKAKATPGKDEPNKGNPPAAAGGKP